MMDEKNSNYQGKSNPYPLSHILQQMTKDELTKIRQYHDIPNLSKLKKDELITALVQEVPRRLEPFLRKLDKERYQFLLTIVKSSGVFEVDKSHLTEVVLWRKTGLLFYVKINNDKKVLIMPQEILNAFQGVEHTTLYPIIERNTEWILLSQGMLYYYGVLTDMQLLKRISNLTGKEPHFLQFHDILRSASEYYYEFRFELNFELNDAIGYWAHFEVQDPDKIYQEQRSRRDLEYASFSKSKLLKAGSSEYRDEDYAFSRFKNYLLYNYGISQSDAKEIAYECQMLIKNDLGPGEILDYLGTEFEFPTFEFVQELMSEVTHLSNHTRQWVIKGHRPNDLLPTNGLLPNNNLLSFPTLTPSSSENISKSEKKLGQVIELNSYQKTGRNDPCPCGSGKKYKRCCGK